jgi:hypothetical protein
MVMMFPCWLYDADTSSKQTARYGGVTHVMVKNRLPTKFMRSHIADANYFTRKICGCVDVNYSTQRSVLLFVRLVRSADLETWGAFWGRHDVS